MLKLTRCNFVTVFTVFALRNLGLLWCLHVGNVTADLLHKYFSIFIKQRLLGVRMRCLERLLSVNLRLLLSSGSKDVINF